MRTTKPGISVLLLLLPCFAAGASEAPPAAAKPVLPASVAAMLHNIKPAELKGDLSFLASDTLAGRFTPSPGLDVAAEFIAAKFRAAGLEPGGDEGYFQVSKMVEREPPVLAAIHLSDGSQTSVIPQSAIAVFESSKATSVDGAAALVFAARDLEALKKSDVSGKAVIVAGIDFASLPPEKAGEEYRKMREFDSAVASSGAAVEIIVERKAPAPTGSRLLSAEDSRRVDAPVIRVASSELERWLEHPAQAAETRRVSFDLPAPIVREVALKNVIGILRGTDPNLKGTCVMLTAHYDHIGTTQTAGPYTQEFPENGPDRVFNGANDDGSGTVSVIEIGRALAGLRTHPRRSIVFMTFFGEERGELGSRFYGQHPVFPIAATVADINLEQVGRTDSSTGKQINTASLTGYDYSDVTHFLEQAGRDTGVRLYKDAQASDAYFTRSDNDALAQQGVPAHSLTVAFEFPDYHGLGDEWQKVDYDNMARVDRMIGLALLRMANSTRAPEWNARNPKTEPFRAARRKLSQKD